MRSVAAHALALLLSCAAAAAQSLPDYAKDSLGEWLAVPDDGRPGCRIRLTAERTIGGWSAIPAATCRARKVAAAASRTQICRSTTNRPVGPRAFGAGRASEPAPDCASLRAIAPLASITPS